MRLILASASPRRRDLLARIGVEVAAIDPAEIDETPLRHEKPSEYARRIAAAKAAVVAPRHPGAVVLAADTVVAAGRRILPKAESADDVSRPRSVQRAPSVCVGLSRTSSRRRTCTRAGYFSLKVSA